LSQLELGTLCPGRCRNGWERPRQSSTQNTCRKRVRFRERGVTALKRICRTCVRHLMGGPGTVEYPPDKWRGELEGLHIKHVGDILITVKVTWTDGSESEVKA
jgi:hypothetical protein